MRRVLVFWRDGVSVLVGPVAIRSSRRKEKASKTEKVCIWLVVLPSTLTGSLRSLTRQNIAQKKYKVYEERI